MYSHPLTSVHPEPFGKLKTGFSKDARSSRSWTVVRQAHHERLEVNFAIALESCRDPLRCLAILA